MARSSISTAVRGLRRVAELARARTVPGVKRPSLLSNTARMRIVPRLRVDAVVDELQAPCVRKALLVGEPDRHRQRGRPRALPMYLRYALSSASNDT